MKYYTPEIEEFHVGFEYESHVYNSSSKALFWLKAEMDLTFDYYISNTRVKYLDKEDIESFGFVFKGGDTHLTYHYGGYAITHTPSNNKINIYCYDGSEFVNVITIKNKSELKKLLKQLNI